jgi:hypothetical protein
MFNFLQTRTILEQRYEELETIWNLLESSEKKSRVFDWKEVLAERKRKLVMAMNDFLELENDLNREKN